ncbi:unnamed protein product [Danaus chrysippus]|uniref:(African queen) hypothetical protein n=1 Tax=Danaus chrysippus TaxID=151541 RepID=A0A8J2QZM1_9NEOP|nr:unnamed protein product [Danaus chrysippus]
MIVLEKFLKWKLHITSEEFQKYCKNYLPLRHRPMSDIIESLDIAQNNIQFTTDTIRRNGCLVAADPVNTKLMLENVDSLGGLDIREAIKIEPSILKNNYQSLLQIRSLLEQYNIPDEAQQRCLKVYCMNPKTVQERLDELVKLREFQVLETNPRVLYMVVHKRKMLNRITKIQAAKKQCYSLNHLVSSNKIFNTYINSFGNKICSRDVAVLICSSLHCPHITNKSVLDKLRRHKYWLHTALHVVNENLLLLKQSFSDLVIYNNCQIVLYPVNEIQQYIDLLLRFRENGKLPKDSRIEESSFNSLKCAKLTDDQILSLVLYEIEKKYHFSGDGIWNKLDGGKIGSSMNHRLKQNYAS